MTRTRIIFAVLLLALAGLAPLVEPVQARPAAQRPKLSQQCMDATARVLAARLPGSPILPPGCLPRSALTGKVAAPARTCPASECSVYLYGKKGLGYHELWIYPVMTVDFYGFRCFEDWARRPQGEIGTDRFGLFDSRALGQMTHSPIIWLAWCSQNGLVRSGATVVCGGDAVFPWFTQPVSCSWSISPWFKPTRTVGATWTFNVYPPDRKATAGLIATMVANPNGRDVLILGWRWSL